METSLTFLLVELDLCVDTVEEQVTQLLSGQLSVQHGQNVHQTLGLQVPQDVVDGQPLILNDTWYLYECKYGAGRQTDRQTDSRPGWQVYCLLILLSKQGQHVIFLNL